MRGRTCVALVVLLWAPLPAFAQAGAPGTAPDLQLPAWSYCAGAGGVQMACYDQAAIQQLLRIQAAAQYGVRLNELRLSLEARTTTLVTALEGASESYAGLQAVIMERNLALTSELIEARADAERYRGRLERRRVWPWVTLGLGLLAGILGGVLVAN